MAQPGDLFYTVTAGGRLRTVKYLRMTDSPNGDDCYVMETPSGFAYVTLDAYCVTPAAAWLRHVDALSKQYARLELDLEDVESQMEQIEEALHCAQLAIQECKGGDNATTR